MFRLGRLVSVLAITLFAATLLSAQQPPTQTPAQDTGKNGSITGCLAKGDQAGMYQLMSADNKTYILVGNLDELEENVGKQISVAGAISNDKIPDAPAEAVPFKVSAISKIADTCQ